MSASKVLVAHPRAAWQKLGKVLKRANLKDKIEDGEIVAIKMHFGEMGNIRYIHPSFARQVVDAVKEAGGKPFLTDSTTLYRHARHTLLDYMETAAKNGFSMETMGCPVLIADGMRGTTGEWVQLKSHLKLEKVKVAQAVFDSDFLIALSHLTLHPGTGIGASVKNIAMGCTTTETKLAMHASEAKPKYNEAKCTLCLACVRVCPSGAFYYMKESKKVGYEPEKCVGCGECIAECPSGAITVPWESVRVLDQQKGVLDGCAGVISGFAPEKKFFINIAMDITSHCDCPEESDLPIVPDIGILASNDVIACDKASFDLMTQARAYPSSELDKKGKGEGDDKVRAIYPEIDMDKYWSLCRESGMGNLEYEVEKVD